MAKINYKLSSDKVYPEISTENLIDNERESYFNKENPDLYKYESTNFDDESKYDKGLTQESNQNLLRANNQGITDEIGNVAARTLKVIPGIASTIGMLGDYENYLGALGIVETDFDNALSKKSREVQQGIDEAYPLYKKNPEKTMDWTDSSWIAENIDGVKNSVIEFGITGLGVSTALSGTAKLMQAQKLLRGLGTIVEKGNQLTTSLALTHTEGVLTGIDVYDKIDANARENLVYDNFTNQIVDKKNADWSSPKIRYRDLDEKEIKTLSSEGAATAVRTNYVNAALQYTALNPFFNSKGLSRNLQTNKLKKASSETLEEQANRLDNLKWKDLTHSIAKTIAMEVPQEGLEEGINVYAEKQGLAKGKVINEEDATLGKVLSSEEGLNAMLWGAIGAVGQTGTIKVAAKLKNKIFGELPTGEQQQFQDQKSTIISNIRSKNAVVNRMNDIVEKQKTIAILENSSVENESQAKEKEAQLNLLKEDLQSDIMYDSFYKGTTENLHDIINAYGSKTKEEFLSEDDKRTDEDWKDYQEGTQELKKNLANNEVHYNKIQDSFYYMDKPYKKALYNIKTVKYSLSKQKEKLETEKLEKQLEVNKYVTSNSTSKDLEERLKSFIGDERKPHKDINILNEKIAKIDKVLEGLNKQEEEFTSNKFIKDYNKNKTDKIEKSKKDTTSQQQKKDNNDKINKDKEKVDISKQKKEELDELISKNKPAQEDTQDIPNETEISESLKDLDKEAKLVQNEGFEVLNKEKQQYKKVIQEEEKNETSRDQNETLNNNKVEILDESEFNILNSDSNKEEIISEKIDNKTILDGTVKFGRVEGERPKKISIQTIANRTRGFDDKIERNTDDFLSNLNLSSSIKEGDIIVAKIIENVVDKNGNYKISLFKDDFYLGAIHIQDYIDNGGIAPNVIDSTGDILNNIDLQTQILKQLRDNLNNQLLNKNGIPIENVEVKLQITGKSHGFIFDLKDTKGKPKFINLNEALANDAEIIFVKSNGLYVGQNVKASNETFVQQKGFIKSLLEKAQGCILLSIPTSNNKKSLQFVKVPTFQEEKLNPIKDKIKNALRSWIAIETSVGYNELEQFKKDNNLEVKEDFENFVNNYIYTTKEKSDGYQLTFDYTNNLPTIQISNINSILTQKDGKNVNDTLYINKDGVFKRVEGELTLFKQKSANDILDEFFTRKPKNLNVNINTINSDKKYRKELNELLEVNFKGHKIEEVKDKEEITYFANPVISFKLLNEQVKKEENKGIKPVERSVEGLPTIINTGKPIEKLEPFESKLLGKKVNKKSSLPEPSDIEDLSLEYLVKGFNGTQQKDILNSLLVLFDGHYRKSEKSEQYYNSIMNKVKNSLEKLKNYVLEEEANNIQKVLDNFDEFSKFFQQKLKVIGIVKKDNKDIVDLEFTENNNIENINEEEFLDNTSGLEESDGLGREENFNDGAVFETNSFKSIGTKLKVLLSKISSGKTSIIGMETYLDPEIVYYDLMKLFQGTDFSKESKLNLLLGNFKPYLDEVYDLYNESDEQTKNQFNRAFNLQENIKELTIIKNESIDNYSVRNFTSNQSTSDKQLIYNWLEPTSKELYTYNEETDSSIINETYIKDVIIPKFQNLKEDNSPEKVKEYLDLLGINIDLDIIQGLKNNIDNQNDLTFELLGGFSWNERFKNKGLFWFIHNSFVNGKPQNEKTIKDLAKYVTSVLENTGNSSYKNVENKTIFGYTIPNRLLTKLNDIKSNYNNIIENLKNTTLLKATNTGQVFSYFLNEDKDIILNKTLNNENFLNLININPVDGVKNEETDDKTTFAKLQLAQQERLKVDYFVNDNKQYGNSGINICKVLTLSKSDKSTNYSIEFALPKKLIDNNGILSEEVKSIMMGYMMSEYNRYYSAQEYNKRNNDNTIQAQFPQYNPEAFYLFPFLNNIDIFTVNKELLPINESIKEKLLEAFNKQFENDIKNQIEKWNDFSIIKNNELYISKEYKENKLPNDKNQVEYFAKQYILGNYIGNMEYIYLFSSDPATTAKSTLDKTLAEYFKRLSKEISPFEPISDSNNPFYYHFVLEDEITPIGEEDRKSWKDNGVPEEIIIEYNKINIADAAEYVTLKEHITMLNNYGKITDTQYKEIQDNLGENGKGKLNPKQIGLVLQVLKPLQVGSTFHTMENHSFEQSVFVKSAQFPLIPQLIKGSKLEGLLDFMLEHKIDRIPLQSAVKQGSKKRIKLNDIIENREKLDEEFIKNKDQYVTQLPRRYMGLQQETPYDENAESKLLGSQIIKLIHNSISKNKSNEINEIENELLELKYNNWKREIVNDKNNIDIKKLHAKLMDFAIDNNWSVTELQYLALNKKGTDFEIPLWSSTNSSKIESLIVSDFNNNVIKQELPGIGGLLGSTLGLFERLKEDTAILSDIRKVGTWKPEQGLKPMRFDEKGKVLPAQILVPSKFKINGKVINIKDYIKGENVNINEEVLKLIGYRIPTQSYSSMSYMEIVGFLPDYVGDLLITPKEFIVQMGSDFDIDKLYVHFHHTSINEEGKLDIDNSTREKELENNLFLQYKSVLKSKDIFNEIVRPINGGILSEIADKIEEIKPDNNSNLIITPYQQTLNYYKGTLAKTGIAKTALLGTLNSLFRNKDINLLNKKGTLYKRKFRGENAFDLSNKYSVTGRLKSTIISEIQSLIVDHIKELKADKINYNDFTHNSMSALIMMGEDWDFIGYFLPQESVKIYVNEMQKLQTQKLKNKEKIAFIKTKDTLITKINNLGLDQFNEDELEDIDINTSFFDLLESKKENSLKNMIEFSTKEKQSKDKLRDYYIKQLVILTDFIGYNEIGMQLFNIQMGLTVTKNIGKNFVESIDKIDKAKNLKNNSLSPFTDRIQNKQNLLTGTPIGKATVLLHNFNQLYKNIIPYDTDLYKNIFSKIAKVKTELSDKNFTIKGEESIIPLTTKEKRNTIKFIRSAAYSQIVDNVDNERKRLLFDFEGNPSIGMRWKNYLVKYPDSFFKNRVFPSIGINGQIAKLKFVNINGSGMESDADITTALIDMLQSDVPRIKKLAEDTILYNFIIGGNQDAFNIIKYIPAKYLSKIDFVNKIKLTDNFDSSESIENTIVKQYIQHNPKEVKIDSKESPTVEKYNSKFVSIYNKKTYLYELYEKVNGEYIRIPTLGKNDFLETDINDVNKISIYKRNNIKEVQDNWGKEKVDFVSYNSNIDYKKEINNLIISEDLKKELLEEIENVNSNEDLGKIFNKICSL